ncbi:response regulator transcription factor [Chelativorans salis]|uniref:Response regulator transcription factor n=1 Tax=Chelativorans salis TaxID=2978478 RepID=A0ABT2LS91_9HYPH|nr:response regulator transcription factor [Chelativorans sp. EGI FJ00035]MCT7377400.1 response regulator transcription factor [Chelativorans sp. EGI FJ00035]
MQLKILIADDDPHIREVLDFALRKNGHETIMAKDGEEALRLFGEKAPDIVVLDVGMPERDGLEVCRSIRRDSDVPVLFLSARDEEIDRILGLEIGGDDYLTKPFSPRELVTRIGVIMRRAARASKEMDAAAAAELSQGDLRLDRHQHAVTLAGTPVFLTSTEFAIVAALLERPGQIFDRSRLMARVYRGNIHVSDRTIDSHIRNVRAKFAAAGCTGVIDTLHRIGFRLGRCVRQSDPSAQADAEASWKA